MSTSVDLALLKTLFPQSITFDCCSTKGKVVNITAWLSMGGVGHDGKTESAEVALPGAKNEKRKRQNMKAAEQRLFFLLLPPGADEKGHLFTGYSQYFICMHNMAAKSQPKPTAKAGTGGTETPASVPGCNVTPSL